MDCLYINLAQQETRRNLLEANFAEHKRDGWSLFRQEAFGETHVRDKDILGRLMTREKACYLSHLEAIKNAQTHNGHTMILEDDAMFGPHSCAVIDQIIESMPPDGWDVLFTDIGPGNEHYMIDLLQMRRRLVKEKQFKVLSLQNIFFGAATAYILNERSKDKVLAALTETDVLNIPYDLALRNPIFKGDLKGWVIFPFVTTLSDEALRSQIQEKRTSHSDFILTLFRKAIWYDRDLEACQQYLTVAGPDEDQMETKLYGKIFGNMLSENFAKR